MISLHDGDFGGEEGWGGWFDEGKLMSGSLEVGCGVSKERQVDFWYYFFNGMWDEYNSTRCFA